jgi:hypothetical protein
MLSQLHAELGLIPELKDLFDKREGQSPFLLDIDVYRSTLVNAMKRLYDTDDADPFTRTRLLGFLLIDGLDQLTQQELTDILGFLEEVLNLRLSNLHVLVLSRFRQQINHMLVEKGTAQTLVITETDVEEDIVKYVDSALKDHWELSRQPLEVKNKILNRLKQGGM